jgi:GT2 family glycosyltransferase
MINHHSNIELGRQGECCVGILNLDGPAAVNRLRRVTLLTTAVYYKAAAARLQSESRTDAEIPLNASEQQGTVFVIVPTFNRWKFTKDCIGHLAAQTHSSIVIIVSDGGSTDGTREKLARDYPNVHVVHDGQERWWAGSTALGIDKAFSLGRDEDGNFILLLNNDTIIPEDYVETLVRSSRRENAAVGAKIVDSRDTNKVLDAGEFIRWETYEFPVKTEVALGELFCDSIDVLPGRGSLIPFAMLKSVGNVDDTTFPHYLADYDLFCRLKAAGHRLGVCYETAILAHIEETGIVPSTELVSFRSVWTELFGRRSMTNVRDHWRFVSRHAPLEFRPQSRRRIARRVIRRLVFGTPLARLFRPALNAYIWARTAIAVSRRMWRERDDPDCRFLALYFPEPLVKVAQVLILPRPLALDEINHLGIDHVRLQKLGILNSTSASGWFRVTTIDLTDDRAPHAIALLARAAIPLSVEKIKRLRAYRGAKRNPPISMPPVASAPSKGQ